MATSKFTEFLYRAQEQGEIVAHHFSVGGLQNIEFFCKKLKDTLSAISPELSFQHTYSTIPTTDTGLYSKMVGALSSYLLKSDIENVGKKNHNVVEALTIFSLLHENAKNELYTILKKIPGNGSSLASALMVKMNIESMELLKSIDSVFITSFSDVFAILQYTEKYGIAEGVSLCKEVYRLKSADGDFNRFSTDKDSNDTNKALSALLNFLLVVNDSNQHLLLSDKLKDERALEYASYGTRSWLEDHGIEKEKSICYGELLNSVTSSLLKSKGSTGSIAHKQDNQQLAKKETVLHKSKPLH